MRRRFTLVEVLIIVVVLALLAGLLPVVLHAKREKARRINCAGNLKQVGLSSLLYSGDFDHYFPNLDADGPTRLSFEVLGKHGYYQDTHLWQCPSAQVVEQNLLTHTGPVMGDPTGRIVTYRYLPARHATYRYVGSGLRDDVPEATSVSLAFDQSNNHPRNRWMNVLFADGHVAGAPPGSSPHYHNGPPR